MLSSTAYDTYALMFLQDNKEWWAFGDWSWVLVSDVRKAKLLNFCLYFDIVKALKLKIASK